MAPSTTDPTSESADIVELDSRRHRLTTADQRQPAHRTDTGAAVTNMAGSNPTISAVVCAYTMERWDDIVEAVTSLLHQSEPPLEVVLVVDYNDELLRHARLRFASPARSQSAPVVVVPSTGVKGLSGARNTGVETARGDVVAFLDDDAAAATDWIERMSAHYRDPNVIGVGGYATPVWPESRPGWMPVEFDWVVGCSYRGQPTTQGPVRNFIGCNMSLRRSVFEEVGGFSSAVGRIGKTPLGCEETELCIRARETSPERELRFDPSMKVRHRVSADRTERAYFFRRCYAEGLSKAVVSQLVGADAGLDSERSYVTKILPVGMLRNIGLTIKPAPVSGRLQAAQRAFMIPAGLITTTAGYLLGRARIRLGLHHVDVGRPAAIAPRVQYVTG